MSYLERAKELYNQVFSGQILEAFEKFYHQDVNMIEATGEICEGKDANRKKRGAIRGFGQGDPWWWDRRNYFQ